MFNPPSNNDSLHVVYTLSDDTRNPFEFEIQTYSIVDFFENNTFEIIESERSRLSRFLLLLLVTIILIVSSIATVRNRGIINTHPIIVTEISVLVKTKNGNVSFLEKTEIDLFKIINRLFNSGTDKIELDQLGELMFKGLGYKTHITTRRNKLFDKSTMNWVTALLENKRVALINGEIL